MKLMFLNITTNGKGAEGPANIWRSIGLVFRKSNGSMFIRKIKVVLLPISTNILAGIDNI
jgi:hypothetical protein